MFSYVNAGVPVVTLSGRPVPLAGSLTESDNYYRYHGQGYQLNPSGCTNELINDCQPGY